MHVHDVRNGMRAERALPGNAEYTITISSEYQPLGEFDPHQTRKGISARPWARRRTFVGDFQIPGDEGVFTRVWKTRLPIRRLYGPSLGKEAQRGETLNVATETVRQALPRRLVHEIGRMIGKREA